MKKLINMGLLLTFIGGVFTGVILGLVWLLSQADR
jgi:hypothetical protein